MIIRPDTDGLDRDIGNTIGAAGKAGRVSGNGRRTQGICPAIQQDARLDFHELTGHPGVMAVPHLCRMAVQVAAKGFIPQVAHLDRPLRAKR